MSAGFPWNQGNTGGHRPPLQRIRHLVASALDELPAFLGLFGGIALPVAAYLLRKRSPSMTFWLAWFVIFIYPFSNLIIQIGAVMAERFVYIASAGIAASIGIFVDRATMHKSRVSRVLVLLGVLALVIFYARGTVARNRDWSDVERFWRAEVDQARSEKAYNDLANVLWDRARPTKDERLMDESDALLREGLAVAPRRPGQYTNDRAILSLNYAHHLRDRGHVEESLQYFDLAVRILESMPEMKQVLPSASFYALYGDALLGVGKPVEAESYLRKALAEDAASVAARTRLAESLAKQGKTRDAVDEIRRILAVNPHAEGVYELLGKTLADFPAGTDSAPAVLAEMREKTASYPDSYAYLVMNNADALREKGRLREAVDVYQSLVTHLDSFPGFGQIEAPGVYINMGAAVESLGQLDAALSWYRKALELKPKWAIPTNNLGNLYKKQGNIPEAIKWYREAVALDPSFAMSYLNLGITLLDSGSCPDEPRRLLTDMARLTDDTADNSFYRGFLAARMGDYAEAERLFRHALALQPTHSRAKQALDEITR